MGWRWMFYACTIPAGLFFISDVVCAWRAQDGLPKNKGNHSKVQRILAKIGGGDVCSFRNSDQLKILSEKHLKKNALRLLKQPGIF